MNEHLAELLNRLPAYLGGHLLLSLAALGCGLVISLPLGVLASRRPRLAECALGVAGVVQTVPSLALLALMVLVLAGRIGFLPAFIALTLYSVLPILANTITGIRGVDPSLTEAARGLGMTSRQTLLRVELPLAAPVIIAGIRTATVLVVGTATLVTPVGGVSLGNYIFGGLESLNHLATVFGCVLAAVLAIVLDQLVRLLELAARRRSRPLAWAGAAGLLLVLAGGLYEPAKRLFEPATERAVIATGPFTEQHVLDAVLARRLEDAGFRVDRRPGTSEGIQFLALFHDQVDCIVNYTGNVWTLLMKREDFKDSRQTLAEVREYLRKEHGVVCLGPLGFENAYAIAVPNDVARELDGSLENLAAWAKRRRGKLRIGGDSQFFTRPEWTRLRELYGLYDGKIEELAMDPTLMYGAVRDGQVDVIVAYTSDGRIPAYGLEVLKDPQRAFPPYDAILLLSPAASRRPGLKEALGPLVDAVRLEAMRKANYRVDVDHWTARRAAEELLERIGLEK
ncbi:MAG: ABC transporter permease/substrate-binding protein [Planctomycetes bacterium]|nr:ABC transporter permease/substrate-binding protein [Planctomycetota bacterium]